MKGLYSQRTYHPGEELLDLNEGIISRIRTRTSIQVGTDHHVEHPIGQYINHSCTPNTEIRNRKVIAAYTIHAGEEITFNYICSEDELSHPFYCSKCGKHVTKHHE